jgi:hypothetical protein
MAHETNGVPSVSNSVEWILDVAEAIRVAGLKNHPFKAPPADGFPSMGDNARFDHAPPC